MAHTMRIRPFFFAITIALSLEAGRTWAHSELVAINPPPNSVLTTAPKEIRLSFNENVEVRFSRISLKRSDGSELKLAHPVSDATKPRDLAVVLPALTAGRYEVQWQATSADSHRIKGSYRFEFRP
jgi:copper resistance protein C